MREFIIIIQNLYMKMMILIFCLTLLNPNKAFYLINMPSGTIKKMKSCMHIQNLILNMKIMNIIILQEIFNLINH